MNNNNIERNLELIQAFDSLIDFCKDNNIYEENKDKVEFICIYHMYIFAITRVLNTNNKYKDKVAIVNKFKNYIKCNFPNFKQNKYLYLISKKRKLIYNLINLRLYYTIVVMFNLRKRR